MEKLISVIIPVYNAEKTIAKAVDSVLAQTYKNIELIIINDASTDKTEEVLSGYEDDRKVSIINHENNSGTAAKPKNTGIKKASGQFIAFLDADDYWENDKLEKQIKLFSDKNIGLVYSDGLFIGEKNRKVGKFFSDYLNFKRGNVFGRLITSNFIPSSSVVVCSEILKKTGDFPEDKNISVGEDYDLWLKIARVSGVNFVPEPLFKYSISNTGLSGNKSKGYKCMLYLYRNWLKKDIKLFEKILLVYAYIKTSLKIITRFFF